MTWSGAQTQVQSVPVTVSRVLRRRRRSWGAVEQLPSGRFRARVLGPDGRYVSAPTTFASRTDAPVWLDVQHADPVRDWHYQLGRRLAADLAAERDRLVAAGRSPSAATVRDGRTRQAQAYRLLRAAMNTAHGDGLATERPCRIACAGTPRSSVERRDLADRLLTATQVAGVAVGMPARYRVLVP